MANGARYSTFKESSTPGGSWITDKMTRYLASNWLLECCCSFCYAGQKAAPRSESNDASETDGKKNLKSNVESQIPSSDFVKSKSELTEEIPLTKRDYGVSKNDEFLRSGVHQEAASPTNHKDDYSIDTSDSNKSSFNSGTLSGGMKRVIGSLPVLSKKEKKSPSINNEKKVSESDSELGYPASIFAKCSKRYGEQKVSTMNIPELIIS